jgi:hypothetical protein
MFRHSLAIALLFILASVGTLPAQVPQLISYQGRIVANQVNFDGTGQFKFALVNAEGSASYWSNDGSSAEGSEPETAVALPVSKGLYSVLLGDATQPNMAILPATVFTHGDVHLRVWFNDGVHGFQQLSPDRRIAAVGYAMMADSVVDGAITSAKLADGAVTSEKLAPNVVQSVNLAPGAVGSTHLASDITLNGTTTGNINGSATSFTGMLSGDVTGTQNNTSISDATVTGKKLTGFAPTSGEINSSDTILSAISKISANTSGSIKKVDRQSISVASSTTSNSYQVIATLTTRNIGESGCYLINFNCQGAVANTGHQGVFVLSINNVDITSTQRTFINTVNSTGGDYRSFTHLITSAPEGTVISIKLRSTLNGQGVSVLSGSLTIDGVPQGSVQ